MYLSRLILNKSSQEVRRDLRDCQELHRTITTTFLNSKASNKVVGDKARLLYRLEEDLENNKIILLVQSEIMPDWSELPTTYLAPREDNMVCKSVNFLYERLVEGMSLRFHLKANPTSKDSKERNRKPLKTELELMNWLKRKGEQHGFEVVDVSVETKLQTGWRRAGNNKEKQQITFNSATFDGQLIIRDKNTFTQALKFGVGSGKGYGFGLLSVSANY